MMSCTGLGLIYPRSLDEALGLRKSGERGGAPPMGGARRTVSGTFAPRWARPVFAHVKRLRVEARLVPGKRPKTAVWCLLGRSHDRHCQYAHRVLNRARGAFLRASRTLRRLLPKACVPEGPVVRGIEETLVWRCGAGSLARCLYHDPVRSSPTHFLTASRLWWISLMVLTHTSWIDRVWVRFAGHPDGGSADWR
jgi:hypothetical protein